MINNLDTISDRPSLPVTRDQMMRLEQAIIEQLEPVDLDRHTQHHFAPGVYVRELFIPAGTVLTGKIHRCELMNILVSGTIRVTTDDGVKELTGPQIFNSQAETKKAGFAVTDTIWLNVHPTNLTDLEEIEEVFIAPSFAALEQEKKLCLGQQ